MIINKVWVDFHFFFFNLIYWMSSTCCTNRGEFQYVTWLVHQSHGLTELNNSTSSWCLWINGSMLCQGLQKRSGDQAIWNICIIRTCRVMPHPKKDWELRKNIVPVNKNRSWRTDIYLRFYEKRPNQCLSDGEKKLPAT